MCEPLATTNANQAIATTHNNNLNMVKRVVKNISLLLTNVGLNVEDRDVATFRTNSVNQERLVFGFAGKLKLHFYELSGGKKVVPGLTNRFEQDDLFDGQSNEDAEHQVFTVRQFSGGGVCCLIVF
ncbi:hypothetical protein CASFOL_027806 [Castilleja foliolosa]|uniref:Uncharacterized protein n=1 Tax=Castilleja foliolosa TaxID=1961234 RepID=A0ABD3CFU7_9LAMI